MRHVGLFALAFALVLPAASGQQTMYALGSGDGDGSANLVQIINYGSGIVSAVDLGETNQQFGDVAVDPTTGKIYAANFITPSDLYEIDLVNGPILIGSLGFFINALEFDTKGKLYGWGGTDFVSIDPSNAGTTLIGNTSVSSGGDLACDLDGSIYGVSNLGFLIKIDPELGLSTTVGQHGGNVVLFGIEIDLDGTMYGVRDGGPATDAEIYTVHRQSGIATSIGVIAGSAGLGVWGISFTQQCGFTKYGAGIAPAQTLNLTWRIGAAPTFQNGTFVLSGGTSNGVALLLISVNEGFTPVGANTVLVDISPGLFFTATLPLNSNGLVAFPLSASNASIAATPLFVQAIEAAALTSSNGLHMKFCP